jgi:hypothetical protein
VTIFLGGGDGTFMRAMDLATGDGPAAIATGNFNGGRRASGKHDPRSWARSAAAPGARSGDDEIAFT